MLKLFLEILKSLERFLDRRRRVTSEQTAKHRKAVERVWDAVRETEAYLYDLRQGAKEDRGREAKLSRFWARAALDVQAVDGRLPRIARVEAFGWANPGLRQSSGYEKLSAQVQLVRKQCEWLLERWK